MCGMSASQHAIASRSADVLRRCLAYANAPLRARGEKALSVYDHGKMSLVDIVSIAYEVARKTWSAREAVRRDCDEHPDREWKMLLGMVRPSTGHLLKRLQASIGGSVDKVLSNTDAEIALSSEEMEEIEQLRTHVREDLFVKNEKDLALLMKSVEKEAKEMDEALKELNGIGEMMRGGLQDQTLGRHRLFQEQWFLYDRAPTIESLRQEIQFCRDQLARSPFHE